MSEYRNDPPIDFLLDEGSEDYANRYNQHIRAMTAEGLSAKSDIAWELTIRDQRIAELEEQNKRMVGLLKEVRLTKDYQWLYSEYGEFEWIGDRDEVLASMEPRKLTGYESEALNNALTASSKLVGKGMEKDDAV